MVYLSDGCQSRVGPRRMLLDCAQAGIEAVVPDRFLPELVTSSTDPFWLRCSEGPYVVLAMGKAAVSMTAAVADVLGPAHVGVVATHVSTTASLGDGVEVVVGGHPVPDEGSLRAGRRAFDVLEGTPVEWPVVVLISGGASALCEVLKPGIGLGDLEQVTEGMLRSGLAIDGCNVVRQALSVLKGGGLAAKLAERVHRGLVVSDVVGGSLESIASGPLTASTWRPGHPWEVLPSDLKATVEPGVAEALRTALPCAVSSEHVQIVADASAAAAAAQTAAEARGLDARIVSTALDGDATKTALELAGAVEPGLRIFAGETTVRVAGSGIGGRNQHAALAYALHLGASPEGGRPELGLMVGTDGRDGPTDAAGGLVDQDSVQRIRSAGLDPHALFDNDDSHRALDAAGDLVRSGPTGTNVGDLWLLWREP